MLAFGYRHRWLRRLGDDWQMVETNGRFDEPDLRAATTALVESTGHPALAAHVSDSDCLVMCTAVPGATGPLTHLPRPSEPCSVYVHAGPRTGDEIVAELIDWSSTGGLRPDTAGLRSQVHVDEELADDLVFRAYLRAIERKEDPMPVEPWEAPALALEADLWAALYRPDADVPALVRRTAEVVRLYEASRPSRPSRHHEFWAP
ncbi:hypothetical protein SAMN05421748_12322 [Paractinoplanes atraurantiacus]|uniref:Uncharacterized protein n=2 Tax=Paractinoplanes atraurantiacus TaxID=1036182 RepID=A0A285JNH8_9ACTN|nr:hypothetical protein SAMN05421748_12322 [Actinoplanes atraurantiacus]